MVKLFASVGNHHNKRGHILNHSTGSAVAIELKEIITLLHLIRCVMELLDGGLDGCHTFTQAGNHTLIAESAICTQAGTNIHSLCNCLRFLFLLLQTLTGRHRFCRFPWTDEGI